MRAHRQRRKEVFVDAPRQVILTAVESLAEKVGPEVGVGILDARQVRDAGCGRPQEVVDREARDAGHRRDVVIIERQAGRRGRDLGAAGDEVIERPWLEIRRRDHRHRAGLVALRLGGEFRGVGEALRADMDDDLDAGRPRDRGPAVAEREPFGQGERGAFAGRAADEHAVNLPG